MRKSKVTQLKSRLLASCTIWVQLLLWQLTQTVSKRGWSRTLGQWVDTYIMPNDLFKFFTLTHINTLIQFSKSKENPSKNSWILYMAGWGRNSSFLQISNSNETPLWCSKENKTTRYLSGCLCWTVSPYFQFQLFKSKLFLTKSYCFHIPMNTEWLRTKMWISF